MMARIHPVNIVRHGLNAKKIIKGDSIPQYIINTTETIQKKLFDKKPCQVFIVRNAAAKDLSEVIQNGAGQTVLVVGGHGDFGSLEMTDKRVISEEIASPELKLKAFVQHTCGVKGDNAQVEMGKRFAEQTFGWTRIVYPLDLIEQPLPKRSSNSATN
jgi:hypothetical protein